MQGEIGFEAELRSHGARTDDESTCNEQSTMASGVAATRLKKLHFINWLNGLEVLSPALRKERICTICCGNL